MAGAWGPLTFLLDPSFAVIAAGLGAAVLGWAAAALYWSAPPSVRRLARPEPRGPLGRVEGLERTGDGWALLALAREELRAVATAATVRPPGAGRPVPTVRRLLGRIRRLERRRRLARSLWWPFSAFTRESPDPAPTLRGDVDRLFEEIDRLTLDGDGGL